MTQYELERAYAEWQRAGADPARTGTVGQWTLELDGDRLLLNPAAQRWFYFDAVHDEWADTGVGGGEAILVSLGGVVGAKRALSEAELALPLDERIERVAALVVVARDGELLGPVPLAEAQALVASRPGAAAHVWSTRQPAWTPLPAVVSGGSA